MTRGLRRLLPGDRPVPCRGASTRQRLAPAKTYVRSSGHTHVDAGADSLGMPQIRGRCRFRRASTAGMRSKDFLSPDEAAIGVFRTSIAASA